MPSLARGWSAVAAVLLLEHVPVRGQVLPWDPANVPGAAWPAESEEESNAAWPAGAQPASLVAWPKESGSDEPAPCWNVSVLEDTARGWAGQCMGLSREGSAHNATLCEAACRDDPECPVWQWNDETHCWVGQGQDCDVRDANDDVQVLSAQRLQHGVIRVLADLQGWQVHGMRHLGLWHTGGVAEGLAHCRNWCYSDINCQYWQYGNDGCWVEDPSYAYFSHVQYPLTTPGGASSESDWAKTTVGGEFIQHICPVRPDATAAEAVVSSGWSFLPQAPWREGAPANAWVPWLSVLALLFVGGCLGCTLLGRGHDGGTRPQRSKRAVRPGSGRRIERSERSEGDGELAPLMATSSNSHESPGDASPLPQTQPFMQPAPPQMQPMPQARHMQSFMPPSASPRGVQYAPGPGFAPLGVPSTFSGMPQPNSFQLAQRQPSNSPAGSFQSQYAYPARP